jgi:hypothetical protein
MPLRLLLNEGVDGDKVGFKLTKDVHVIFAINYNINT